MIELEPSVLAYASASYCQAAAAAAVQSPGAIKRMIDKLQELKDRHGAKALKHTAVLSLAGVAVTVVLKALDNAKVAAKVSEVSGKLQSITTLVGLSLGLYALINSLLDMATPVDDEYQTVSMKQRLDDLAMKNEKLDRSLRDVQGQLVTHQRNRGKDLGKEYKDEVLQARKDREEELQAERDADEEDDEESSFGDVPYGSRPRHPRGPRTTRPRKPAYAATEATAFSFLHKQLPGSVTTRELYPEVHTYREADSARFLQRIDNMSPQQRNSFAQKLARSPEQAQGFVDHVFAIVRRMRKDAVGQKVHKLGAFVVKWATIFAVQAIMFKMLVYVTKANVFNAIGGGTRFVMAGLCAVNSVLLLVHTAAPEDQEHGVVRSIKKTANHSKKLLTQMSLKAA